MLFYLLLIFSIILIFYLFKRILTKNYDYWATRNVPHVKPIPLFGNYTDSILLKRHRFYVAQEICEKFPSEPYVGTYYGTESALLVQDINIIKLILAKDFYNFNGRENTNYVREETVTKNFFFNGGDEWKVMRQNSTPLFTTSKMKKMFPLIINCTDNFKAMIEMDRAGSLDAKSFLAKYTMDCISNCAFGFNPNTMTSRDASNVFVPIAENIFSNSISKGLRNITQSMWPNIFYGLKFKLFHENITVFFNELLTGVFNNRINSKTSRNDFIDLILKWKKNNFIYGDKISNMRTGDNETFSMEVTNELLVSQCVLMFGAGFETTATTMSFLLYELAKSQNDQKKVIEEVDAYLEKHNGIIEYECTTEMPYLEACIEETLRRYPVLGVLTREVTDDYTLPTGLELKKNDRIHIPVYHLHHDPKYFTRPEEFIPERFFGKERKNITPYTYMPFGEGPRICIGVRFAKMVMFPGFLKLFKDYRVELADNMPSKIRLSPYTINTVPSESILLKLIPRKS